MTQPPWTATPAMLARSARCFWCGAQAIGVRLDADLRTPRPACGDCGNPPTGRIGLKPKPRGTCSHCGRNVALRKNGTLYVHDVPPEMRAQQRKSTGGALCPRTGELP